MGNHVRVQVLLSADEGARLNAYCRKTSHKKSPLIARLVREHLEREGYAPEVEEAAGGKRRKDTE